MIATRRGRFTKRPYDFVRVERGGLTVEAATAPTPASADASGPRAYDVVIVGAGAAGIGSGIVLRDLGVERFVILERHEIGASFARWPEEMRFITPSFTSNGFGMLDLNAVALDTSPAFSLNREHPSGREYADYLRLVAEHFQLPIRTGIDVLGLEPLPGAEGFALRTSQGEVRCRFVVWAGGEFQYPRALAFPGAEHCLHASTVRSWRDLAGDDFVIVGGFESGMDAAFHLTRLGKRVRVLDDAAAWELETSDPSVSLSPYTRERLDLALETGRLELVGDAWVERVEPTLSGFCITGGDGTTWQTSARPILATGFVGSLDLIRDRFAWDDMQRAILTDHDESTVTPGLFVVGPSLRHDNIIFCYIYKFRQRFAVVAAAIGHRLGLDLTPLERYRDKNMFLDDLSCCADDCAC
jgi:putative flavoprotein involved in K+ transport